MKKIHKLFVFVVFMFMTGFVILNLEQTPQVWADGSSSGVIINIEKGQ